MQIVPQILLCRYKMSVLWPSKYAKIRFRPWLCLGPRWGSSRRSPDPLVGWRRDTPPHTPPHSARTHLRRSPCVPQKFSQIYAYARNTGPYTIIRTRTESDRRVKEQAQSNYCKQPQFLSSFKVSHHFPIRNTRYSN